MAHENRSIFLNLIYNIKLSLTPGIPLVKPREVATEEDRKALSACCLWSGDVDGAEFYVFQQAAFQVAARVYEVSLLKWEHLKLKGS